MPNWHHNWTNDCQQFQAYCDNARKQYLASLQYPMRAQQTVLDDIVNQVENTGLGKQYGISSVSSIIDFQQQVPIKSYDQFQPWIDQEVSQKGGVLTSSPIARWLRTSGSTGNSKKIPYTKHWMANYRVPALGVLWANYLREIPGMLAHPYATLDIQTVREPATEMLDGIPYQGITNREPIINEHDWHTPWHNAPWFGPDVTPGYEARMYTRLRYFIERDLHCITTINPSTLIALHQHLIKSRDRLVLDIHDGTLFGKKIFVPNVELAEQIGRLLDDDEVSLKDLWPNLKMISCWTSATARLYIPKLEKLFPDTKILPFMTCGTEGIVTLPVDAHFVTGPLAINQGFYEFLPASEDLDAVIASEQGVDALLFHELEEGKEYHLIMSQANGMCRYAVGDIYKVTGFYNGVPRIEFSRRQGTYYSFTGEKLTEPQVLMAMEDVAKQFTLNSGMFMCSPVWDDKPYYKFMLEIEEKNMSNTYVRRLERTIDGLLRSYNEEYASKRSSERLDGAKLYPVKVGTIDKFLDAKKASANAIQYKYKPMQANDDVFNEVLELGM